ncbi:unnamed protein product [Acanthoscelides obtectus]|uniref:Uncharacterized protein n=1 Tax=Acanthoscelides obtectus TaxID=200917 RepID=A0A9P0KPD4_ACAOB|nr:unnamed protein product [Acanthoscelides obtectus]CAK1647304.1 hypothetical protein AOBTE_LOCUS15168 [Acanthoscelides obtectus]
MLRNSEAVIYNIPYTHLNLSSTILACNNFCYLTFFCIQIYKLVLSALLI